MFEGIDFIGVEQKGRMLNSFLKELKLIVELWKKIKR